MSWNVSLEHTLKISSMAVHCLVNSWLLLFRFAPELQKSPSQIPFLRMRKAWQSSLLQKLGQ